MDLASVYIYFDDYESAKKKLLDCLDKFSDHMLYSNYVDKIHEQLAITCYLLEEYDKAKNYIQKVLDGDPNNFIAFKFYKDIIFAKQDSRLKTKSEIYSYYERRGRWIYSSLEIKEFEERLVQFIIYVLKKEYGSDWTEKGFPYWILERISNFKEKEDRPYKDYEYLMFSDYIDIIKHNWSRIFSHLFKEKREFEIVNYLNQIRIIRNRTYHYKEKFYKEDESRLKAYISTMYNYIPSLSELL